MNENNLQINTADVKLSTKEKISFSLGDLYSAGAQGLIAAVYLVFLTLNGLTPGLAATIIMVAKIWDAIIDPTMGIIGDNTRTKWGRRRPYLMAAPIAIIFGFALLFMPLHAWTSTAGKFVVYLLAFLIYNSIASAINVAYYALSTEMTTNYYEKNKMNNIRQIFSSFSSAVSAGVPIILLEQLQNGKMPLQTFSVIMIVGFGLFYAIPIIFTALNCKERVALPAERGKFDLKTFLKPLKVKAFVYLMMMYLLAFVCMDIITTNIVWFADNALKLSYSSFILLVVIMAAYIGMIPFHATMMKRGKSKSLLYRMGIPLYIGGVLFLGLYPSNWNDYAILGIGVLVGIGMSGCMLMPWYIFPDVVDIGELKFGERNTGSYSGIMTFIRQATAAIAIGISGWVLQLSGFKEPKTDYLTGYVTKFEQSASAVWGLRLVILVPIVLFVSLAFFFSIRLNLTPKKSILVSKLIGDRTQEENLSPEEQILLEEIKRDLL